MTLRIVYKVGAIPVYGWVLNKQGSSNPHERIALLQRFIRRFGRWGILGILGDREFIGDQRWQWLSDQDILCLIRMKENPLLMARQGYERPVRSLFAGLAAGKSRSLRKRRRVGQQWVWLSGMKLDSGELLILAGNQCFPQWTYIRCSMPSCTFSRAIAAERVMECWCVMTFRGGVQSQGKAQFYGSRR